MKVNDFMELLGADFYTGVPDSRLKPLCNTLLERYGTDPHHHVIAANEGNCAAIAAGYHLATGKVPVVYLQNSGEGNIINPLASLLNEKVYGIPVIFVVGWRGEPGVHDEPQHIYQGEVTLQLLEDMGVSTFVIDGDTTLEMAKSAMERFHPLLSEGRDVAFVVKTGGLQDESKIKYHNENPMRREEIIRHILRFSGNDPVVSTTGKASRELFELRAAAGESHKRDFLTVGSMGHSSSIALGVALPKPETRVWCIDGDGAVLMHMGAMAVIGATAPKNLVHVVVNNGAHESVGGMPTVAGNIDLVGVAKSCGYPSAVRVESFEALDRALQDVCTQNSLSFIEVSCAIGARADLGRPTVPAKENKEAFMAYLQEMTGTHGGCEE